MSEDRVQKVKPGHLRRDAYVYVRQSTLRQVVENTESTRRQYDLQERAVALGWPRDRIVVIDDDLGQSATSGDRSGFERLQGDVRRGLAGIVMSLEVSRLARRTSEWRRLLEICGATNTLILDEEGIYDPTLLNDRVLLGLKGTISEVEYWLIRARLVGGILGKAERGELRIRLPVGLVYDWQDHVVLDPDQRVQDTVRQLFAIFRRVDSAFAMLRTFREQGLEFPRRMHSGPRKGEIVWGELTYGRVVEVLHNPRYAGAYAYGRRSQSSQDGGGRSTVRHLPPEQWHALILDAHPGYISWQEFEDNQRKLQENALGSRKSGNGSSREGPALLQGLAVCGVCGKMMRVRYHSRRGALTPDYVCQGAHLKTGSGGCQSTPGAAVDKAVGELLVETMSPVALEVALAVQEEVQARIDEADRLRAKRVEEARYEAEMAQQRFMQVNPGHRLVADTLEMDWNHKLQVLSAVEQEYERRREADRKLLDEETRAKIMALASDFPALFNDPKTPDRERKRMARLVLEDVTLVKGEEVAVHVRFKGGASKTLTVPRAKASWEEWRTSESIVRQIDEMLEHHTPAQVASALNDSGQHSGQGKQFDAVRVGRIQRAYGLKSRYDRLRENGMLTAVELGKRYGVHPGTVRQWRTRGHLVSLPVDETGRHLYEDPGKKPAPQTRGTRRSIGGAV